MSILCTILTIGDELLIGQIVDTNSAFIAQRLSEIGISVHRRIAIADKAEEIKKAITASWEVTDIIITTGGLGPTKDDITKTSICELFDVGMKRDEETYRHVKLFFEERSRPFLPVNEAQADIPENAHALFNARGTAPGMWIENKGQLLISLPGVPYEMEHLMRTHVIERLADRFKIPALYHYHIQTMGIGESFLAEKISAIENELPSDIKLAYLPSPMTVNLRLSGIDSQKEAICNFGLRIEHHIQEFVYGNTTKAIEELVFEKLRENRQTLTLVESCTGGFLANSITNLQGASEVFLGGWNVYTNEFKENELNISIHTLDTYSAVSEECGRELLLNALVKTKANFGISIVGYLEKTDEIPSPYAYITCGNIEKQFSKKLDLFYPRVKSKEAIAKAAWVILYREFLLN